MTSRQHNLNTPAAATRRHRMLRRCPVTIIINLHRQKYRGILDRSSRCEPGISQPFVDQVRVQSVPPRHLRNRYTWRPRLQADRALLLNRPKPMLATLRHSEMAQWCPPSKVDTSAHSRPPIIGLNQSPTRAGSPGAYSQSPIIPMERRSGCAPSQSLQAPHPQGCHTQRFRNLQGPAVVRLCVVWFDAFRDDVS